MKKSRYSKEEFIEAVAQSTSIAQVLVRINLVPSGGNYLRFHALAKEFNLDIKHFKGQGWNKGSIGPKVPIAEYVVNNRHITSHKLRLRLINEGHFEHKCSKCLQTVWNNQPIPLELEHKDGDSNNNLLTNLELLCPNCHAQTPTYRGRNKRRNRLLRKHLEA